MHKSSESDQGGLRAKILDAPWQPQATDGASTGTAPATPSVRMSLVVLGLIRLVDAIEYGVIMPSLATYMQQIEGHSNTQARAPSTVTVAVLRRGTRSQHCMRWRRAGNL